MVIRPQALTAFFQTCWEVLKEDIMAVFQEFHGRGNFEKSINATFISLTPKSIQRVSWSTAYASPMSISFDDFLVHFSLSSSVFPSVFLQCTKGRPTLLTRLDYYLSKNVSKSVKVKD